MRAAARQNARYRWQWGLGATLLLLAFAWGTARLSPDDPEAVPTFVPQADAEILETLPRRLSFVVADAARRKLSANPTDVATAVALARSHYTASRAFGDPRELGYAQAALAPWWNEPAPPTAVALLRAAIHSQQHRFDAALADLQRVTLREPANVQAWLSRASIEQTTGDFAQALQSCQRLEALSNRVVAHVCAADLESLSGDHRAFERLQAMLTTTPIGASELGWALTVQAEMAERLGRDADAERAFTAAITTDEGSYARTAFADYLMLRDRWADAAQVLDAAPPTDAVLLRRAIAGKRQGHPEAGKIADDLRARFALEAQRGDAVHLREMARLALEFDRTPEVALRYAQRNWAVQKEPADLLLLLATATAARRPDAADVGERFIARHHIVDARLAAIREIGK